MWELTIAVERDGRWVWVWCDDKLNIQGHSPILYESILDAYQAAARWAMLEGPDALMKCVCQVRE